MTNQKKCFREYSVKWFTDAGPQEQTVIGMAAAYALKKRHANAVVRRLPVAASRDRS